MQLDDNKDSWAVEVNTDWALLCTPTVELLPFTDRLSLPVNLRVGKDFYNEGRPHVEVGIENPVIALTLVLASLAAKAPISIKRKEAGGLAVAVPLTFKNGRTVPHEGQARAEVDATVQRRGRGLHLDFHQLNAVLRMRQE